MIKAFGLYGTDNGSDFYDLIPESLLCKDCRTIWDEEYVRPVFNLNKNLEVSCTYDNVRIVNGRFKKYCEQLGLEHVDFIRLNSIKEIYVIRPRKIIRVDRSKTEIVIENYCNTCGLPEGLYVPSGVYIEPESSLVSGIYATDMKFSGMDCKSRMILVGVETAQLLKAQKFKGASFVEIY